MTRIIVPVIMSGGSGTRLWPLSRQSSPKQLHALTSDLTLIQHTIARVNADGGAFVFADPMVILNERQLAPAQAQIKEMGRQGVSWIVEPCGRNTAPVAAVAAEAARARYGEDAMVLLMPADHHIDDEEAFRATAIRGAHLAQSGRIVTFGIKPTGPATGFGYIRRGDAVGDGYLVDAFKEKPKRDIALEYVADGRYYWNAGIFLFGAGAVADEMMAHCPELLRLSRQAVVDAVVEQDVIRLDQRAFEAIDGDSFDYAVMEHTGRAAVVPADFGWSDVGSWSALWEISDKDDAGNAVRGDVHLEDVSGSIVYSTALRVGVIGAEDLIVVATEDAVLVARKSDDQAVKKLVERLRNEGRLDLL
ncbi:mannose-1-phosphate guanylyltransferase/mannose-6-phosphate isomerase [Maricaulis sp.]|uniref:mannose-1-phosphate guanylyltransferase/mannose-6-phosphate isomerase n=1 Tax=Maricaulis sp. TaxID=1486257 RepID=UPI00262C0C38|nr:mannose-1-phosphate guanylyltransferase/mannose-6-phosphate isomerase [Maricaulis sp.]